MRTSSALNEVNSIIGQWPLTHSSFQQGPKHLPSAFLLAQPRLADHRFGADLESRQRAQLSSPQPQLERLWSESKSSRAVAVGRTDGEERLASARVALLSAKP